MLKGKLAFQPFRLGIAGGIRQPQLEHSDLVRPPGAGTFHHNLLPVIQSGPFRLSYLDIPDDRCSNILETPFFVDAVAGFKRTAIFRLIIRW